MALQPVSGFPGVYRDDVSGDFQILTTVTQRPFYDSIEFTSGSQTAGTSGDFFDNQSNKKKQHANLKNRTIPAHHQAVILRVGLYVRMAQGNSIRTMSDAIKMYENLAFEFKIGTELISEGPALIYPSGYGLAGATTENNISVASLGIASVAAAPTLRTPQPLTDDDDLNLVASFPNASWLSSNTQASLGADCIITAFLDAIVEKRQGA